MQNKFKIFIGILLSLISLNCYRDQPSSYNIDKIQSIELIYPKGGESFKSNQSIMVQWQSLNITGDLRIELIDSVEQIYSKSNIPDSGSFLFQIPSSATPSFNYKLKIESMNAPQVFDVNSNYFEIAPAIDGHWTFSDVIEGAGLELSMDLSSYIGESFLGDGNFYFKYSVSGHLEGYESNITIGGILSYPQIGFQLKGDNEREFNITGKMINNNKIRGQITGIIDSYYGSISDSITLTRQD